MPFKYTPQKEALYKVVIIVPGVLCPPHDWFLPENVTHIIAINGKNTKKKNQSWMGSTFCRDYKCTDYYWESPREELKGYHGLKFDWFGIHAPTNEALEQAVRYFNRGYPPDQLNDVVAKSLAIPAYKTKCKDINTYMV